MYSGRDGIAALPYFDEFDLSTIDVLLISQYVPSHSLSTDAPKSLCPAIGSIV
jgi:cleavage and polyadenylation specificity factor subunit 3